MRDNGWFRSQEPAQPTQGQFRAAKRRQKYEIRGYEIPYVHGLWHLDFHHAKVRVLDASGNWHQPIALAILDDYSRLCCHLQLYLAETAECLIHGLTQAFMKRGLPRALMTDNGAAMLAEETRLGLSRLGLSTKQHYLTVGVMQRPQSKLGDFYRELGELFNVGLSPVNRYGGFKALRERWINHCQSTLFKPVLLIDEAQQMSAECLTELRILQPNSG